MRSDDHIVIYCGNRDSSGAGLPISHVTISVVFFGVYKSCFYNPSFGYGSTRTGCRAHRMFLDDNNIEKVEIVAFLSMVIILITH